MSNSNYLINRKPGHRTGATVLGIEPPHKFPMVEQIDAPGFPVEIFMAFIEARGGL